MRKLKLLVIMLCTGTVVMAQQKNPTDTIPKRDSLIIDEVKESVLENIPTISLDDNDLGDAGNQNVSSVLTAGRDPFYSAASFNFSPVRFRVRGYDADLFSTYLNGIPMENLDNGFTPFGLWGGLNDVMRNRDLSLGLNPNTYSFGDIGSTSNIDARASKQRKQTSISYAYSNRNYTHRLMLTHSTGMSKRGWAFSFSGSRRYADEGYVPGTYYNGWSYFVAVDKRLGQRNMLSLIAFGAPTESGRQGASVMEMQNLAGTHYYNPYWGYQNGKVRNSSIAKTNQPFFLLTHDLKVDDNSTLVTSVSYSFGDRSTTALDWYNAADPRPDYYRYLPSYEAEVDPVQAAAEEALMKSDINKRQVNWEGLYNANRGDLETINNVDGIPGNTVTGLRSRYIVGERVINTKRMNFNSVLNTRVSNHADLTIGISNQYQRNHYYQKVNDLLGGDFWMNLNQFAERDYPNNTDAVQNDLNNPNQVVKEGGKYGYNYDIDINKTAIFLQSVFKYRKFDFHVSGEFSVTTFYRVGHVRNGLFPDHSYGESTRYNFDNYAIKGGVTYKINGRNYLFLNGAYLTRAPFFENAFIAPRTRDYVQNNLTNETIQTAEAGYIMNAPNLKIRLTGYYTRFDNGLNVLSFYHDDYRNFVNYALSNIDKLHFGGEFGFEAKVLPGLTVNGAAAVGRYYYNSRQNAIVTIDNSAAVQSEETVYSQNYRVPSTPQEAYSLGLNYRSKKFWYVSLTGSYFDQMWLDFNPIRRTAAAVDGLAKGSDEWNQILAQTKWDPQYTLDFFGGYSYKMPRKYEINHKATYLVFNLGVNNILNNKDIITGGYEQLRFDFQDKDISKFPPKVYYAYGLNYYASVILRF